MKDLSVERISKMVFGVSKDESILERKESRLYFYRWRKMEQYESP